MGMLMKVSHKLYFLASGILDVPVHGFFTPGESTIRAQPGLQNAHYHLVRRRESTSDQTLDGGKKQNKSHPEKGRRLIQVDPPVPSSSSATSILQDTKGPEQMLQ
jgi:hypothetical protein